MRTARRSRPPPCPTTSPGSATTPTAPSPATPRTNAFDKDRRSYFIEFHWARYFGERMHWRPISRASLPGDLEEALRLACEPAAKELPGYRQDCPR